MIDRTILMSRTRFTLCWLLVAGVLTTLVQADVIVLKSGRRIEGKVVARTASKITVETRFGNVTLARSEIEEIQSKLTPQQEFERRLKAAKTADECFAVCQWAVSERLRPEAKRAAHRAVELDPDHAAARAWRGEEFYGGRWLSKRAAEVARKADEGLVPFGDRWVTPAEKEHLEAGRTLVDGEWMTEEEALRARGFVQREGRGWISRQQAEALDSAKQLGRIARVELTCVSRHDLQVAGTFSSESLDAIAETLAAIRASFDASFGTEPGLELLGGRVAQFYVLADQQAAYERTADRMLALTDTVPAGWAETVKKMYGFWYVRPFCLSVTRQGGRDLGEAAGQSSHNWAHMLVNRRNHDHKLLPAWFDEAYANLVEFRQHGRNTNPCVAPATDRLTSVKGTFELDGKKFRSGLWREGLREAIEADRLPSFGHLTQKGLGALSMLDVAYGMGIIEWLESHETGTLGRFHGLLRETAPDRGRVYGKGSERIERWERVFQESLGMSRRRAEAAWSAWLADAVQQSG